jgi:hypothetical protein
VRSNARLPVPCDTVFEALWGGALLPAELFDEPRLEQAVQRAPDRELDKPGLPDDVIHRAGSVQGTHDLLLVLRQLDLVALRPFRDAEDQVERRNPLFDHAPLIDTAGTLEQEVLRVDRDQVRFLLFGHLIRIEVKGALLPGKQVVDGLGHLELHVVLEIVLGEAALTHEDPTEPRQRITRLLLHGRRELVAGDHAILNEKLTEAIGTVEHGRIRDAPGVEVDVSEILAIRDP